MYVIGTAGHVDHGKSTLIEALTGIDPDRLAEEKERAMTIDLGFAWLELAVGSRVEEVGVVDVPGHRDFIENMLAGIGGIDLALFVVAADEGVMPQTTEHLAIIDLLEVASGVIALTKIDLIDDPDWLELVTLDLQEKLEGTVLAAAPIISISAQTGEGLQELRDELSARLAQTSPKLDVGRPRLPIDRVFTLSGFGTIVTGTLSGGQLSVGDAVEIQPGRLQGRIRGLQTHKTSRDTATPGSRVAVNISGVDSVDLHRGMVVARPGQLRPTILIDVSYRHLSADPLPLKHNSEVKLFTGATEVMARTRVLGSKVLQPGQRGWLQLALNDPVAVERGDHFILRRPSPGTTIGGGIVLDPHPGRRHKRFQQRVIDRLQTLAEGTPEELLFQRLERLQPATVASVIQQSAIDDETARSAWQTLLDEEKLVMLGQYAVTAPYWAALRQRASAHVVQYHKQHPLRRGIPREEIRNRLNLDGAVFNALVRRLEEAGELHDNGAVIRQPEHEITFSDSQQSQVADLLRQFQRAGVNSPGVKESRALLGDDLYEALVELGQLCQINEEVVYRKTDLDEYIQKIIGFMKTHESASAAEIRDLLGTSRKYAIALLEHLDQHRITRRIGDERVLVAGPS